MILVVENPCFDNFVNQLQNNVAKWNSGLRSSDFEVEEQCGNFIKLRQKRILQNGFDNVIGKWWTFVISSIVTVWIIVLILFA